VAKQILRNFKAGYSAISLLGNGDAITDRLVHCRDAALMVSC
jgi:hypothetical protein